jgi:hypothetical protein
MGDPFTGQVSIDLSVMGPGIDSKTRIDTLQRAHLLGSNNLHAIIIFCRGHKRVCMVIMYVSRGLFLSETTFQGRGVGK